MMTTEIMAVKQEISMVKSDLSSVRAATGNSVITKLTARLDRVEDEEARQQDRARRNNLHLAGLKEGAEGDDPVGFLRKMIPQWLPSLEGSNIEVMRAHRLPPNKSSRQALHLLL